MLNGTRFFIHNVFLTCEATVCFINIFIGTPLSYLTQYNIFIGTPLSYLTQYYIFIGTPLSYLTQYNISIGTPLSYLTQYTSLFSDVCHTRGVYSKLC